MSAIDADLSILVAAAADSAQSSSARDWGSGDVVSVGGLMAVVGGMAENIGLVNTGAALGLVGGTGKARYQYQVQRQAYRKAESSLSCIHTQVRLFTDTNRILVLNSGDGEERVAASRAPNVAIDAVNKVRRRLLAELDAVNSEAPTRQDIEALAQRYAQAASAPAPTPAANAASAVATTAAAVESAASAVEKSAIAADIAASAAKSTDSGAVAIVMRSPMKAPLQALNLNQQAAAISANDVSPTWLIDNARNLGKAFSVEIDRCAL